MFRTLMLVLTSRYTIGFLSLLICIACHNYGVGQLSIGLMAEICIELIKIPNTIIYTGEVDDFLVAGGLFCVGVGALLLLRHVLVMFFFLPRRATAAH